MRRFLALTTLLGCALPIASARAADPVVVNQSARQVSALNGMLVYERKPQGKWLCMRSVGGHVSVAHGVPAPGCEGRMALDSKGRVVLPFTRYRIKHGAIVSARRYLYDVKSDRVQALTGLPSGMCPTDLFAIWRKRVAYVVSCSSAKRNGLWVKDGKKAQRILATPQVVAGLALRGSTLAGLLNLSAQDTQVYQLMVAGKRCVRAIPGSNGNLENEELFKLWIANGNIVWPKGYFQGDSAASPPALADRGLFTSKVPSECGAPGPTGRFDFNPETTYLTSFDLDGNQLYYSGYDGIRRHTLPAQPSF